MSFEGIRQFIVVAASWWEPGSQGVLDIGDISAMLGLIIALAGVFMGITKWWLRLLRGVIREEIEVATEPIHPNSNGGLSLADVARRTENLEKNVEKIQKTQDDAMTVLLKVLANSENK